MKKKSAAFLKVDSARDRKMQGKDDLKKKLCPLLTCVVYTYTSKAGKPCAIAFKGRAIRKAAWHHSFGSAEFRNRKIMQWMSSTRQEIVPYKRKVRELEVGDLLVASWGYEQTNIDYYKVLRLKGKLSVELVEVGSESISTDAMVGKVMPRPDIEIGEAFTRRVEGKTVKIKSFITAHLEEPTEVYSGVKIYKPRSWTAYN